MNALRFSQVLLVSLLPFNLWAQYQGGDGDGSSMAMSASFVIGSCFGLQEEQDEEQAEMKIIAFPNPFSKTVTLKISGELHPESEYSIYLLNSSKQSVGEYKNVQSNELTIHIDQCEDIIVLLYANGKIRAREKLMGIE
jgi:hypothetical protein